MDTFVEQALNHPSINSDNPWGDCFYDFPLHPYSEEGIKYSEGVLQIDGGWGVVFADNSRLVWNDSGKNWLLSNDFDLDEELESLDIDLEEIEKIKLQVSQDLAAKLDL